MTTIRFHRFRIERHVVFLCWDQDETWWRHQMETFSALLAICAGNSPVHGEFPTQRPVTRVSSVSHSPTDWMPAHKPRGLSSALTVHDNTTLHYSDISNHWGLNCLINRLFRRRSKKTSKLLVTGLSEEWPVGSPHKGQVTRKMFPFDGVIMRIVEQV